jgi:hypothetical protein
MAGAQSTANGTNVQQWAYEGAGDQKYQIVRVGAFTHNEIYQLKPSHALTKCVDITNASTAAGANVQIWDCLNNNAQKFRALDQGNGWFVLQNVGSLKCVEVASWSTVDGGNIAQWDCHNGENMQWQAIDVGGGFYRLVNRNSGKVLEMAGQQSTTNGTNVQQWTYDGSGDQKYQVVRN